MNILSNVLSFYRQLFLPGGGPAVLGTSCPGAAGEETSVQALTNRVAGATGMQLCHGDTQA